MMLNQSGGKKGGCKYLYQKLNINAKSVKIYTVTQP